MEKAKSNIKVSNLGIVRLLSENLGVIIGFLLISLVLTFATDTFLSGSNMVNILRQVTVNTMLSCGMGVVLLYGAIDLSMPALVGLSACLSVGFIDRLGIGWLPACLLAIFICLCVGTFNGLMITRTNIPAFIITLAMQNICRGICRIYTDEKTIVLADKTYIDLAGGSVLGIPAQVIWMLFALLITAFLLRRTTLGRHIYATGGNKQAALYSGINVKRVGMFVYLFSAFMASLAGIYTASRTYAAMFTMGERLETYAISAAVLGGISMSGGVGGMFGVIFGVLLIGILNNGLNLLGIDSSWQYVAQGAVILIAVYTDYVRKKKK